MCPATGTFSNAGLLKCVNRLKNVHEIDTMIYDFRKNISEIVQVPGLRRTLTKSIRTLKIRSGL